MIKSITLLIMFSIASQFHGQARAGINSGQAFSVWPDTGQATCYDDDGAILNPCPAAGQPFHGQDAQHFGPARSYTKLDGSGNVLSESASSWTMVRDNVTGLIWEAKVSGDGILNYANPRDADNTYTWCDTDPDANGGNEGTCGANDTEGFLAALNGSAFGGHTDWRLPTISELLTLADRGRYDGTIAPSFFPLTASSPYWSSTTYAGNANYAWFVNFLYGNGDSFTKSDDHYVRAVRGGREQTANRFTDNGNGTVTDTATCLQWQQATADTNGDGTPDPMSWQNALAYTVNLSLAGYDDWRLPDINELLSLVDFSNYRPAIDTAFPDTLLNYYWSSTTFHHLPSHAWRVFFGNGYDMAYRKTSIYHVRAVRGSQCAPPEISPAGQFPVHLFLLLNGKNI